jgi:hypothetical protein
MFEFLRSCIVVACGNYFIIHVNVPLKQTIILQLMYNVHTCDHAMCHECQCHGVDSFECSSMYLTFSLVLIHF